jgi:hypothetical protein
VRLILACWSWEDWKMFVVAPAVIVSFVALQVMEYREWRAAKWDSRS